MCPSLILFITYRNASALLFQMPNFSSIFVSLASIRKMTFFQNFCNFLHDVLTYQYHYHSLKISYFISKSKCLDFCIFTKSYFYFDSSMFLAGFNSPLLVFFSAFRCIFQKFYSLRCVPSDRVFPIFAKEICIS